MSLSSLGLLGRKVGMMRLFTDDGDAVPVTVLDVSPTVRSETVVRVPAFGGASEHEVRHSETLDLARGRQVTAIENMIAAGAKTILITPSDAKAIVPSIKKARDKGVMVIALDSPTDPADAADALFATDNYKAGVLIGRSSRVMLPSLFRKSRSWLSSNSTRRRLTRMRPSTSPIRLSSRS